MSAADGSNGVRGDVSDRPAAVASGLVRGGVLRAVLRRPDLWVTAARSAFRLAPNGWWRRAPYLPLPSRDYLHFRMVTAYGGDGTHPPDPHDLVTYLEWCRAWPAVTHRS